ncbi:hypothetical protein SRABI128_00157 [Microbacterium sp. Bi128]|nr:hypothetical protein SRABI128_00157 [Microbacterium sp. Bi128]
MLVTVKPTAAIAMLAIEKLRSRNSSSGTRGSVLLRAWVQMNRAMTATPAATIAQIHGAQSKCSPSCRPNTMRNRPTALRATPTRSNLWDVFGSCGTSTTAAMKPMIPTGMLMKKIHSHPRPSTSRPPASGPTRVATPAVAPHSPMAAPRRWGGKVRVMTAMVCGVMSAAPSPCTARAMMSTSSDEARPHASEARVKIARPTR